MAINLQEEHFTSRANTDSKHEGKPTVLIFDSGVGGLSVYSEIEALIPELHFIYAFDNEGFPYGEKTEEYIVERVLSIVKHVNAKYPLSLAVIACNTASTVSLPPLRETFDFPIIGVVPAIKPAAKLTSNQVVGILATKATVKREYTKELIERFATDTSIHLLGTSELVDIAEDKLHGKPVDLHRLENILQPWLKMKEAPDTVVLGCTHFPLLSEELLKVLPEGTRLVDSGQAIARRTAWILEHEAPLKYSCEQNLAICTELNEAALELKDVLYRYHLEELAELKLLD
ncbi:glutamate racemase [Thorsellia kenyensis]|uniref:Glutamate racemase n=1 Tax=Thorsellia kenyensis TaxID=1549888 RepID=A0ABV6C8M8_9GAMM